MDKPIQAFYACYLLRSTVRHQSLYVGSTPVPIRRLRQHNGDLPGGAVRTSKDSLRPWEMTCLVTGFPSKIAALQFEWAWQNTHLTRHVSPDSRLTQARTNIRFSPKTGRMRKRPAQPRVGLTERLANLHLLLRANSFERWPLKVTFYAEDVHRVWVKRTKQQAEKLRPGIEIAFDNSTPESGIKDNQVLERAKRIQALDVGYSTLKPHIEKRRRLLESAEWLNCGVCHSGVPSGGELTLLCPHNGCNGLFHLECLSAAFLQEGGDPEALVPLSGRCPSCEMKILWTSLVKELSLNMRGAKEMENIFKKPRGKKLAADADSEVSEDDEEMEDVVLAEDECAYLSESSDTDEPQIASDPSPVMKKAPFATASRNWSRSEPVIEDSDWDEAEIIT